MAQAIEPIHFLAFAVAFMAVGFGGAIRFAADSTCLGGVRDDGLTYSICEPRHDLAFSIFVSLGTIGGVSNVLTFFLWRARLRRVGAAPLPS